MKNLTPVEEIQNKLHEMMLIEYGFVTENVEPMKDLLTQDRHQAYTRLVEEINKALFDNCDNYADGTHYCNGYEQACADILEKVVKPLYGKE